MSLGSFPLITLSEARQKVLQHKRQLLNNINPIEDRKLHKKLAAEEKQSSIKFNAFASQFIEKISPQWTNSNHEKAWIRSIEIYASPIIGNHALSAIKTEQITKILEPIWHTKHVTASRLRGRLEKIFSAAITTGFHAGPNPAIWTGHLENLLPNIRNKPRHYKALDYKSLPDFMKKIASSKSVTSLALQFTILTASRAGETLNSKTEEIFGDVWIIPKERMKARLEHQVPLSNRALEIISEATACDPESPYIFSINGKPLAHTSMLHYLNAQGVKATVHGFRSSFRDWVSEETNHSSEVAEMALAHTVTNKVEAAYRRGNLLQRRKQLMNDWEDFCLKGIEPLKD
jgi:integrase